jgi:hypothetical protein
MTTRPLCLLFTVALLGGCPSEGGGPSGSDAGGDGVGGACAKAAPGDAACNPYCQEGCAAGDNCTFDGGGWACVAAGPSAIGEACGGPGACAVGLACFRVDGETAEKCRQICIADGECPDGRRCNVNVDFGDGPVSFCGELPVGCDPFAEPASACGAGQACYLDVNAGVTGCQAAGTKAAGEACWGEAANVCAVGLQCVVQCAEVCSTGAGSPKCSEVCPGEVDVLSEANALGACVPDAPRELCDLFAQGSCGAGAMCTLVRGGIACIPAGTKAAGEPCSFANDCAEGSVCAVATCRTVCDASAGATTAPCDSACAAGYDTLIPQTWGLGVCKP